MENGGRGERGNGIRGLKGMGEGGVVGKGGINTEGKGKVRGGGGGERGQTHTHCPLLRSFCLKKRVERNFLGACTYLSKCKKPRD